MVNDSKERVDKVKPDTLEGRRLLGPLHYKKLGYDMQGKCLSGLDKDEPGVRKIKFSRD